ncbi:MAG: transglycosylase SLT domain-containing protein [Candidatus Caldarchaeum sp.]
MAFIPHQRGTYLLGAQINPVPFGEIMLQNEQVAQQARSNSLKDRLDQLRIQEIENEQEARRQLLGSLRDTPFRDVELGAPLPTVRGTVPEPAASGTVVPSPVRNDPRLQPRQMPRTGIIASLEGLFSRLEREHSLPRGYLARTALIESGGRPDAANPRSSARGLFQFIRSTAAQMGLRDPNNPYEASAAAARLASQNRAALMRALGREPSAGELYLAHQQGAEGAIKLLRNPGARAVDVLPRKHVLDNGGNASMSAGEFANKWLNKFGEAFYSRPPNLKEALGGLARGLLFGQYFGHNRPINRWIQPVQDRYVSPVELGNPVPALSRQVDPEYFLEPATPQMAERLGYGAREDIPATAPDGTPTAIPDRFVLSQTGQQGQQGQQEQQGRQSFPDALATSPVGTPPSLPSPTIYFRDPPRLSNDISRLRAHDTNMAAFQRYMIQSGNIDKGLEIYGKRLELRAAHDTMQNMQAITEFAQGDPRYLAWAWSQQSGRNIQFQPTTQGRFNIIIDGQPSRKDVTREEIMESANSMFDAQYREFMAQARMKQLEASLQISIEQAKELAQLQREYTMEEKKRITQVALEAIKGRNAIALENMKQSGYTITRLSETSFVIHAPNGQDVYVYDKDGMVEIDGQRISQPMTVLGIGQ